MVDATGRLAAVLLVPLEELLRGLVPSEMPAGSPAEALRAQAVTARSNVLAQVGTRHLADPWSICSEVHCQAYRGESAHVAATDAAVRATRGEALFALASGRLVDGVYSAMCGGHGEDNENVWGGTPNPSLRGRPDLGAVEAAEWAGGLAAEDRVAAFVSASPQAWCARAPGARPGRFRWERRLGQAEADHLLATLGLGPVDAIAVLHRGSSGRAISLRVDGERGSATIHGELRIRRLLGDLPSAMFVVSATPEGWTFRGGGWGHGVGMCQWGAIGRAAAGQEYRRILGAYFSGAEVARVYE
jgi:SpoIID/LytB domain protein